MAINFNKVIIGNGVFKIDDRDVGILESGSQFIFGYDLLETESRAKSDNPILELKKIVPIRHFALFRAIFQEIEGDNASDILNGHTIQVVGDKKRINLGIDHTFTPMKIEFTHTNSNTGATIYIVLWQCYCAGRYDLQFKDRDFSGVGVDFKAMPDRSSHSSNPFGYIEFP